jgi:hypothetical protein
VYLPPPPGTYIALLGIIGFFVIVWPSKPWVRAASFSIALILTGLELHNVYRDRDRRITEEAKARKRELEALKSMADSIAASMTKNQQVFDASIEQMKSLAVVGKDSLNEVTGGESFCFVDMGSIPEGLMANLVHKGKYALSDVRVSITDRNALDNARKSGASSFANATRSFPVVDFLGRASLFHPLGVYRIEPKEEHLRYDIAIEARNGSFTELLRLRKVRDGGWTAAMLVAASYVTTKKRGIVYENVQPQFPRELLKADEDWNSLKKLSVVKVAE